MSAYPYPDEEHYPDDAEHREYLKTFNIRILQRTEGRRMEMQAAIATEGLGKVYLKRRSLRELVVRPFGRAER